jgi:two-component system sensor histidine kinase/response regulator
MFKRGRLRESTRLVLRIKLEVGNSNNLPEFAPVADKSIQMPKSDIMIVDDNPANLKLLEDMLLQQGHKVRSFPLGRLALEAAKKRPPDLILLDINMPEMNGYEVCERLKSIPELASIPVIFLSALRETEDKVKAFQAGAADYISKPFRLEEVHARVETHLKLQALQKASQLQNQRLEEAVKARTLELSIANGRLTILDRSKNDFLQLISHEFRTPLNGLLGASELILERMPAEENDDLKGLYKRCRQRILTILDDALLLTQIDVSGERFKSAEVFSLSAMVGQALEKTAEFARSRQVTLMPSPLDMGLVAGNEDLLVRALQSLVETAVKFSEKGEAIRLSSQTTRDSRKVIIEASGRIIPSPLLAKFFDLFTMGEAITPGGDLGLSAPLAFRILSLFGGSVSVANLEPPGIRLTISLKDTSSREGDLRAA